MTDPYVTVDRDLVPIEQVLEEADILVVATPHPEYRAIRTDKPVADVWNVLGTEASA
jgi:UDP-N-acetyl-D-mannosaminuronic acid dehydrogenase